MTLLLLARFVMLVALVGIVACYLWVDMAGDA
jgi:hypothetical protein